MRGITRFASSTGFAAALAVAALLASTAAFHAASASAATLPEASTAILSGAPSLFDALPAPVSSAETNPSSVSQDGRFVAFQSRSDGLFDGDDDDVSNVYVMDRVTGALTLASRATGATGQPSHGFCYRPSMSDDGSRVAFTCESSLDPDADTNTFSDVYIRDLGSSTTQLVSRAGNLGAVGDGSSTSAVLSETGEYVAFESEAKNLDLAATSGGTRVYRRQIGGGNATVLVSRRSPANGGAPVRGLEPSISDDGNRIAFTSAALEAVDPADTNTFADVYVRDLAAGTTVLASRADGAGAVGNGYSLEPTIAGNGSAVAFSSAANQFDNAQDADTGPDIYRRSLTTGTTALVSVNAGGQKGTTSSRPSMDDTGNVVAFVSAATALHPDDTNARTDAYVKNVVTNEVQVASRLDGTDGAVANAGAAAVAVSGDGTKVAIGTDSGSIVPGLDPRHSAVVLRDLAAPQRTYPVSRPGGDAPFVNEGGFSQGGALSADGRFAAFVSEAPALGLPEGVRSAVFVRDRVTGAVTLASRADGANGAPLRVAEEFPAISGDGRRVAFAVDDGPQRGIWVRDLAGGRTFLASRADGAGGESANAESRSPSLDADGSRVVFSSNATNLGDGDGDPMIDVHLRDLDSGRTILVSRGAGGKGDGESAFADVNADGTRVAFSSYAANLGDGDADSQSDVHLRDVAAQTTSLVSATPDGTKGNGFASRPSIDGSGRRVAFAAVATNLPGGDGSRSHVYVRDLAAGALALASRADGPDGAAASGESGAPEISPDGTHVAFAGQAANLAAGVPDGAVETYVRDLTAGRTELVSRAGGPAGRPAASAAIPTGISAGAGCVAFGSKDALIGPRSDYTQVYMRALRADCATGAAAGAGDTTAPVVSRARLSRTRFRVGRAATPLAARRIGRGTVLRFRSTEAGTASLTFARAVRARTGRTRLRRAGRLTRRVGAGPARIALSGRMGRRPMRAGRYRLVLRVRDAAGNRSHPVSLRFRIVR